MKKIKILFYSASFLFFLISCGVKNPIENTEELTTLPDGLSSQNEYVDNKKNGFWIEYLDSTRLNEVSIENSYYTRLITYENGNPSGKFSDFFTKTGKIKVEGFLISGPYTLESIRPEDKYEGVLKKFADENSKILDFECFDKYGDYDQKSFYVNGIDNIKNDSRYDSLYFSSLEENSAKLKSFEKFHNNPSLYVQTADALIKRANELPDYVDFINFLSTKDKSKYNYFILLDAFEFDSEIYNKFSNEKYNKRQGSIGEDTQELLDCLWCGKKFSFNDGTGTCSLKCRAERDEYQKSRAWEN